MIEAVLFDLDGTLLDHAGAAAAALADVQPHADARRWAELNDLGVDRYLAGELTFAEQRRFRVATLARELGLGEWDDARADAWFAAYLARYEANWRAFPDAAPALAELAGLRLGVITNGDAAQQRAKLARLALPLPHVTISSEAGAAKPAPEIFQAACADLALPPSAVAYVGDRLDVDAVAATAAGLRGVWLDRADAPPPADPPVPRITTLAELRALL
ncbi:HAD family hydrolase [Spirillospora sp. NPDC050679]